MVSILCKRLLLLIGLLASPICNAAVDARVDRNPINESETVTLIISVEDNDEQPDLSPLDADFDVLGTSQSHSMSIINGAASSKKDFQISLSPKQSGRLIIPPIKVGNEVTQPITLAVLASKDAHAIDQAGDIFIEYEAEPQTSYVQQQTLVTVKLYFRVNLNGQLSEPQADKTIIQKLGEDQQYEVTLQNQRYNVVERKYAVFPQASGTLTLPEVVFGGVAEDMNSFFGGGKRVRVKAKPIKIDVKAPPSEFKGAWWLPAQQLTLTETWSPDPPSFRVGEPITRTVTLSAEGLTAAQLPDVKIDNITKAKTYPDQPQTNNTPHSNGIRGDKAQKIAIVPNHAGAMVLPEIVLHWWNTQTNQMETARLPARTVNVEPAPDTVPNTAAAPAQGVTALPPAAPQTESPQATDPTPIAPNASPASFSQAGYWPWLSAGFATLWIGTVFAWMWKARRKSPTSSSTKVSDEKKTLRAAQRELREALKNQDHARIRAAILHWANEQWPSTAPHTFDEIARRTQSAALKREFSLLNQALYSENTQTWQSHELRVALEPWLNHAVSANPHVAQQRLPPLYPSNH